MSIFFIPLVRKLVCPLVVSCVAACGGGGGSGPASIDQATASADRKSTSLATTTASTAWTPLATEGESFGVSGTQTVRYGSDTAWVTRTVTGGGQCSNEFFGSDPLYGVVKRCELETSSDGPVEAWTPVAQEGQSFALSGTQTVRYGAESSWITRPVTDRGECSNEYFGSDPLYGVVKRCETVAAASPSPAPAPIAAPDAAVCVPPISLVATSNVAASVGDGTPASCTESALRSAIATRSVITFNCGPAPATIAVRDTISIPADRDTVIDGAGLITLDGGGTTRILHMYKPDFRTNSFGLTVQRIRFANGRAPGTGYVPPDPSNPSCSYGYAGGSGGAIEVRDARLHVIDVEFQGNAAATPGPDVGGGAIHAGAALDVTIVGSRFIGNTGSNGGALTLLQTDARIFNSVFQNNSATGTGMNYVGVPNCPGVTEQAQAGAGGLAGAVLVDGIAAKDIAVCGSRFIDNRANELAGAFLRVAYSPRPRTVLDRTLFQNNRARQAGAAYIQNSAPLEITGSTFAGNVAAESAGAAQLVGNSLNVVNSTFSANQALGGGGALMVFDNDPESRILNATFADNRSTGGPGYWAAAIFGALNFSVSNTVFSNNLTSDAGSPMQCTFSPATGSNDVQWPVYRIVGGLMDTPCVAGIAFADPQLGSIGSSGGPTPTMVPSPSSPLRGAGRDCPPYDQRGMPRSAACTVGAVE